MRYAWMLFMVVLAQVATAPLFAQVTTDTGDAETIGTLWATGFWILITLVLLICAGVIAFQLAKRPNRR
jgi:NADH:ubiquinone oxidoreductase subunit 6 (subunit J)